ncbi:hypothetical protein [Limnohabitans sp.]|uniref:hypothetical protein n=1 Tax=Limnohabitans sp. TaxID=1907725 RepID=UPI0038BE0FFB
MKSGVVAGDNLPPSQVVAELETAAAGARPTSIATQPNWVDRLVHPSTGAVVKEQKFYRKGRHLLADLEGAAVLGLTDFFPVHIPIVTNSNDPAHPEEPLPSTVEAAGAAIPSSYLIDTRANDALTLAAFDYSTYGILHGELTHISSDTLQEQGPNGQTSVFYFVQGRVLASAVRPGKARVFLKPSMTASLDIRTKIRPVLAYFLKPISKAFDGALMEPQTMSFNKTPHTATSLGYLL